MVTREASGAVLPEGAPAAALDALPFGAVVLDEHERVVYANRTARRMVRGMRIALRADDGFSKLLAAGLTFGFALQTFIIVGGVLRIVPLTGITLPFVSYGGSSIVANFLLLAGLLLVSNRANAPKP